MKRLHVHVAVDDLTDGIRFYSGMFAADPSVVQAGYAKWMLDDPRVNFAISQRGAPAGLNHLGIQVESAAELQAMQARLAELQTDVKEEAGAACCYARSDKYWVNDPSGIAWETFHTLDSIPVFGKAELKRLDQGNAGDCCVPLAQPKAASATSCCVPAGSDKQDACC